MTDPNEIRAAALQEAMAVCMAVFHRQQMKADEFGRGTKEWLEHTDEAAGALMCRLAIKCLMPPLRVAPEVGRALGGMA